MIVLDASAAVEMFTMRAKADAVGARIAEEFAVHVPALFDLEVLQALRGLDAAGKLDPPADGAALRNLADLRAVRYDHERLRPRIWELRHNLTAYDAAYVALAEILKATLITGDRALSKAKGHSASVEVV